MREFFHSFRDAQDEAIYHEVWEEKVYERFRRIHAEEMVVDVGAHVGYFSCRARFFAAKTFSIEPRQDNFKILTSHLASFGAGEDYRFHGALGSASGTAELSCTPRNSGGNSLNHKWYDEGSWTETVEVRTLDSFNLTPTFLKIDVEGFELEVLKGSELTIRQYKPFIVAEIHSKDLGRDVYSWLQARGYYINPTERPEVDGWIMHATHVVR